MILLLNVAQFPARVRTAWEECEACGGRHAVLGRQPRHRQDGLFQAVAGLKPAPRSGLQASGRAMATAAWATMPTVPPLPCTRGGEEDGV